MHLSWILYFKYIDDILLIYPQDLDLHSIIYRLNNVEPSVKYTYELESNNTLPFLDILIIRNINKLEYKVYRKPTCKNEHTYFYLHNNNDNNNTERSIIIDFLSQSSTHLFLKIFRWWIQLHRKLLP